MAATTTISDNTPIKLTVGLMIGVIVAVAGIHPWAMAQVKAVVAQQMAQAVTREELLRYKLETDRELTAELRKMREEFVALKLEVRGWKR